jgi:hypothetical protein
MVFLKDALAFAVEESLVVTFFKPLLEVIADDNFKPSVALDLFPSVILFVLEACDTTTDPLALLLLVLLFVSLVTAGAGAVATTFTFFATLGGSFFFTVRSLDTLSIARCMDALLSNFPILVKFAACDDEMVILLMLLVWGVLDIKESTQCEIEIL